MLAKLESLLQTTRITPINWILGFSGILMVRFFLEALSSSTSSGIIASDSSTLVHYYLFFLATALASMLLLHFALPSWRKLLPAFISISFLIILLAPLIDLIASKGQGFTMSYLFDTPKEMFRSFFTFFGPNWKEGITLGIRVELGLILLMTGWLIYSIRKDLLKTISYFVLLYIIIFIFLSLPGIISLGQSDILTFLQKSIIASATFTNNIHSTLLYSSAQRALEVGFNFLMAKILFIICISLASLWFYLSHKLKFISIIKNSRPERMLAYFSTIGFGMILAYHFSPPVVFAWNDSISILILLLSFYLSWMFAVCVNDIVDEDIDAVTNTDRPLIQSELSIEDMRQSSYLFLLSSLFAGYLSGYYAFFCILAFTALYYIYSAPPTRFKRIPFFSTFIIGLCNLSAALAGFFLLSSSKVLSDFPVEATFGILVFFSLLPNLRDLKDIEGDEKAGINTVPVLFDSLYGPGWGKRAVGIIVALAYLLVPLFFSNYLLYIISIPAAAISYYLCVRPNYKEKPLFLTYFLYLILIGISFWFVF